MKKFLLFLVAIAINIGAYAATTFVGDGEYAIYTFTVTNPTNHEVSIKATDIETNFGNLVLPETITHDNVTYTITVIALDAFNGCKTISSVIIPDSYTTIRGRAFKDCTALITAQISDNVSSLVADAFQNCTSLTTINLPKNMTILRRCFSGCSSLTTITIPEKVTRVNKDAFSGCTSLTVVTIPNSVTYLEEDIFPGCTNLNSIYFYHLPEDMNDGYTKAFNGLSDNCTLYVPFGSEILYEEEDIDLNIAGFSTLTIWDKTDYIEPEITPGISVIYNRNLPSGRWVPIYVPFQSSTSAAGTNGWEMLEGHQVWFNGKFQFAKLLSIETTTIDGVSTEMMNWVTFDPVTETIKAGEPYIVKFTSNIPNDDMLNFGSNKFSFYQRVGDWANNYATTDAIQTFSSDNFTYNLYGNATKQTLADGCFAIDENGELADMGGNELYAQRFYFTATPKDGVSEINPENIIMNVLEGFHGKITDGNTYTVEVNSDDVAVKYSRNFESTDWQPLYVPFDMSYEEWSAYADVAELHNIRSNDTNGDGVIDDMVIEFNKLVEGDKLIPNIPYIVKPKQTGAVTIECSGKTVLAAPAEEGTVECSTTKHNFTLHGVYQAKTDMAETGAYCLSGGAFVKAQVGDAALQPNGIYLTVTPKNGGYNPASAPQKARMEAPMTLPDSFGIVVNGYGDGGGTTSIEDVIVNPTMADDCYYDLMGRRVENPTAPGFYIHNGKKVIVR